MTFLRERGLGVVLVLCIAVGLYLTIQGSKARTNDLRASNITRCIAVAPRAAYDIAFQYEAGNARRAAGNIVTASRYSALADAGILTVAAPKGMAGRKELVEIQYSPVPGSPNKLRAHLSERALRLQAEGCRQAYTR